MTEHRINLTAAEVRAYQAGDRKLRRRVKPQPDTSIHGQPYWHIGGFRHWSGAANPIHSPFVSPGDVLQLCQRVLVAERYRWAVRYTPTVVSSTVEQIDGVWWWVAVVDEGGGK